MQEYYSHYKWITICLMVLVVVSIAAGIAGKTPAPIVAYRIPPEKQAEAAAMVSQLVNSASFSSRYSPGYIMENALETARKVYGEVVIVEGVRKK